MTGASLLLWSLAAAAEEEADESAIVTASRSESPASALPLAFTAVDVAPLQPAGPGLSLAEHALTVPGLIVRSRFNVAQGPRISIRGFGARSSFGVRGVTVVLDGVPLTLADGLAQVDLVDPDLLGRIEVLRGPAGALYGNAAGGVLVLETAGGDERSGEDALARVGSFGQRKLVARAAEEGPSGSFVLAASALELAGYRDRAAAQKLIVLGGGRLSLADSGELRLTAGYVSSPTAEDAGGLTAEELAADPTQASPNNVEFRAGERVSQLQVGLLSRTRLTPAETLDVSAYHVGRGFAASVPFTAIALDREALGASAGLRSARSPFGLATRLTAAVETSYLRDRRITFENDAGLPTSAATANQVEGVLAAGAYGQAQVALGPRAWILGGARHDQSYFTLEDRLVSDGDASDARRFGATTGMLGVNLALAPGVVAYASLADAYETPTISELSLRPDGEAGFVQGLDPQRARNAEAGARAQVGPLAGEAGGFATALRGELVPFSDETGRTYYRNAGRSYRLGAEAAASLALPAELAVSVAYTGLYARFSEYERDGVQLAGNAVPGLPPHRAGAALGWGAGRGPFAAADLEYLAETFADDANEHRSPGYALLGARAGYRGLAGRVRYEVHAGAANLLDETYVDNIRVNASDERFYEPGWPRSFYGGAALGWSREER